MAGEKSQSKESVGVLWCQSMKYRYIEKYSELQVGVKRRML